MSCVLRVSGKKFASSEFAERTDLPVITVYVRGEPRLPRTRPNGEKHQTSGVNIEVSRADFSNLRLQIRHAHAFLRRYKRQLARLWRTPGVEDMTLDFGVGERDVPAQFDYFPPDLLTAAGRLKIGIEISRYSIGDG